MSTKEEENPKREEKEEVTILVIVNDKRIHDSHKKYFRDCNLITAYSKKEAIEKFESNKSILDFIVIIACLHDSHVDTVELVKNMMAEPEFTGQVVAIGNQRAELKKQSKCTLDCQVEEVVVFLQPLISTLKIQKMAIKKEQEQKNNLRVA